MKRPTVLLASLAITLALAAGALAHDGASDHMGTATGPSPLDKLKKLEGEWVGKAGPSGGEAMDAMVTYHVTANGSCVMETLFPGSPHEMVTMYTADGASLVLTHYCAAGNQPHMKCRAGSGGNEMVFDYAASPGINASKDVHMHAAKLVIVDDDHLHAEWTNFNKGKQDHVMVFDMTRRK